MLFGSAILDTAVGLILVFLLVGLMASVVQEAIASILGWRAATLKDGIARLLADPSARGIVQEIYSHGLVQALQTAPGKLSYLPGATFAGALADLLFRPTVNGAPVAKVPPAGAAAVGAAVNLITAIEQANLPVPLTQALTALAGEAPGDLAAFKTKIGGWFDAAMERLSGEYKRRTQVWQVAIGLVLAIALNIDAIRIATTLWQDPTLRATVAAKAATVAGGGQPELKTVKDAVDQLKLPIGWVGELDYVGQSALGQSAPSPAFGWLQVVLGWLLTAASTFFGAPFWFDSLKKLVNLRGTGPTPTPAAAPAAKS